MRNARRTGPSFVRTGQRIEHGIEHLERLYRLARELCPDGFPAEETRELPQLYDHVPLGLVDSLRLEISAKLALPREVLSRDRFSIHGCGPVGLHDDFFRFPYVYFMIVVAHSGRLGLADAHSRAVRHAPGELILLDPRGKHALLPEGRSADEHAYERTHSPVHDEQLQFLFLDFNVPRPHLRSRFRRGSSEPQIDLDDG
jgi:hypothetical protein